MLNRRCLLLLPAALSACANLPGREPLNVLLVGVESLGGEGLELRLAVKLRIQNPNDAAIAYDGISLDLEVRGWDFASGVSAAHGTLPRFGEVLLTVPVSVSATAMIKQAYSAISGERGPIDFVAKGRLAGGLLGGMRFESRGRFDWPAAR
jgi:LEA14-like dessication related protein